MLVFTQPERRMSLRLRLRPKPKLKSLLLAASYTAVVSEPVTAQ